MAKHSKSLELSKVFIPLIKPISIGIIIGLIIKYLVKKVSGAWGSVGENLVNNAGTENGSGNEGSYYLEVSWGSGFNPFNGEGNNNGNSSNGNGSYGNGEFKGYRGGDNIIRCQLYFSHEDLANTAGYPGNIEGATVTFRLNNDEIAGASGNSDYNKNWD